MPAPTTLPSPPLASSPAQAPASLPPLENGDRLTRDEFERRYEAMPDVKKAELIEGVVYMPSPVRSEFHGEQHADLMSWLGMYRAHTLGVRVADNSTVRLDLDNEPQPDATVFLDPQRGGRVKIDADGYIEGAPELVAEVTASTASMDLGPKLTAYRRNGVGEYLVWRVRDRAVDWFVLRGSQYDRLAPDAAGVHRSPTFPGLWLDTAALVAGDLLRVHQLLQQGLASPEHVAFLAALQQQGTTGS
jgi:Uma2 family endonuclease